MRSLYPYVGLALVLAQSYAAADTLHLVNGDRITGKITGTKDGIIAITTGYAGDLAVQRAQISGIATDKPVALRDAAGAIQQGRLDYRDGAQLIVSEKGEEPLDLTSFAALSPSAEALAKPEEPKKWHGTVDAGASLRSGTTDTVDGNLAINLERKSAPYVLTIIAQGAYGEVESDVNTRNLKGETKLQRYFGDRFYGYTLGGAEHDAGRKLDLRAYAGAGAGYDFIKNERRTLTGSTGLEYAREWWKTYDLQQERSVKEAARVAARTDARVFFTTLMAPLTLDDLVQGGRVLYRLSEPGGDNETRTEDKVNILVTGKYEQALFEKSRFTGELTYRPSIEDAEQFRLNSLLALTTPLSEQLNLRVALKSEYDNKPGSDNVERLDNTLLTSLQYKF